MIPICHVQVLPLLSGVQNAMLDMLQCLDRNLVEPHVVCQSSGPLTDELARREIPFHLVPSFGRPIRPGKDVRAYFALRRLFAKHRFRLVHNHSAKPRAVGTFSARHAGVPTVVNTVQGYPFHERTSPAIAAVYRRIEAAVAQRTDQTIFVNHSDEQRAIAAGLVPADRCTTIYNSVDLDQYAPDPAAGRRYREQHGFHANDVLLTVLGRLEEQKQPLILPSIARAIERLSTDAPWQIVVAGDGSLRPELEQAIEGANVKHRVRLLGWQESPLDLLHASDVLLLPSLWEGLPVALVEAHAAGVPCVASDIRGNDEVVTCKTGRLVPATDAAGFASALAELIDSPLLRHQLSIAARSRAEEHFDTGKNNRKMLDVYGRLLGMTLDLPAGMRRAA